MSRPIVFFDIAGPDEPGLRAFYAEVFDWPCGKPGPFEPGNTPSLGGHIRQDPKETFLYIGVEDITATLDVITAKGGEVDDQRFEVPGVAVLGLFRDPAGNRMGLVEMDGDVAKIP
jgi:predicted enzyme related to lactoylglutathione lyase